MSERRRPDEALTAEASARLVKLKARVVTVCTVFLCKRHALKTHRNVQLPPLKQGSE